MHFCAFFVGVGRGNDNMTWMRGVEGQRHLGEGGSGNPSIFRRGQGKSSSLHARMPHMRTHTPSKIGSFRSVSLFLLISCGQSLSVRATWQRLQV